MGIVSDYLFNLIAKQVDDYGLVGWYDPDGVFAEAVDELDLPDTTIHDRASVGCPEGRLGCLGGFLGR